MKTSLHKLKKTLCTFLLSMIGVSYLQAQDILVAEYKFETNQQGWNWQSYTTMGAPTTNPTAGWITGLNWALHGGTAGCIRHNVSSGAGNWFAQSPEHAFQAGEEYYVKFGTTLSAANTIAVNQRVQLRMGTSATHNMGTIVLPSQTIPNTAVGAANYVEYTTPTYVVPVDGNYRIKIGVFFSAGSFACYLDGIRLFKVAPPANTWQGDVSSDWNNPANWSNNAVPVASDQVVIPAVSSPNVYPVLSGISSSVTTLTVQNGASLTIEGNAALTLSGDLTNNGSITVNSGAALVQTASSTASGTGTYNIRRQLPGSNLGFRFMGSPISNLPVTGITGITPTGPDGGQVTPMPNCNPNFVAAGSPYGNILELRENPTTVLSNCAQSLWHVKSAGNLENARGYALRGQGGQTVTFTGNQINNGDVTISGLTRQPGTINDHLTGGVTRGWHLLANPYPSPIVITGSTDLEPIGFEGQIHLFNSATGTWIAPVPPSTPITIAPGQAFQIRKITVGGTSSFTFTNAMRVATIGASFFSENTDWFDYRLTAKVSGNGFTDESHVFFNPNATPEFDPAYDANKLISNPDVPALFTMSGIERMTYNGLPLLNAPTQVDMAFYPANNGSFNLSFDYLESLPSTVMIYLQDKKTGVWTNLRTQSSYTFTSSAGDDIQRFVLHFEPALRISAFEAACQNNNGRIEIINPSNENWMATISNGDFSQTLAIAPGNYEIAGLSAGIYSISLSNNNYLVSETITVNELAPVDAAFHLIGVENKILPYQQLTAMVSNPNENATYEWLLDGLFIGFGSEISFAVADAGNYNLTLQANANGCANTSVQNISVDQTTSIMEAYASAQVRAFPNPANQVLNFVWNASHNFDQLIISDITGRRISETNLSGRMQANQYQMDVRNMNEGIYLATFLSGQKQVTINFIVSK
ncbi:MAG: T9SS type A sorting domain-containing protein [Flavobacteriales bacterium]